MRIRMLIIGSLMLTGCVTTKKSNIQAPSTAAVQGSINSAQRYNDLTTTDVQRIDAKAAVIHRYWDTSK